MPLHPIVAEWDADVLGADPLAWDGYTRPDVESVLTGRTEHYAFAEGRFDVLGGSMGAAHGERVVRAYLRSAEERLPMVLLTASGGARMQEGMVALIQMGRTVSASRKHAAAGLLSIAVHRHPTTGGVLASYGSLTDVRAGSPGATLGFAGPRVVELVTGEPLAPTSHTAEAAFDAGLLDALVAPDAEAAWIEAVLGLRSLAPAPSPTPFCADLGRVERRGSAQKGEERQPTGSDVAWSVFDSWVELRGKDPVVRAAIATIDQRRVVAIAHDRTAGTGRPRPDGFKLARRAIGLADRLGLPLVTLIDTPGADPGPESEAGGIAAEIAATFAAMTDLRSPSVAICVGEGGSGGALAFGHADRLLLFPEATFSVIRPEAAAVILERDPTRASAIAPRLRMTAADLVELGIIDGVVTDARGAIIDALDHAVPGDRLARIDAATERSLKQ